MTHLSVKRIVLTGGPGSGKSSVINALKSAGYDVVRESGRAIIQVQECIQGEGVPWKNALLFAELMLSKELDTYNVSDSGNQFIFYDRAILDILGYLMLAKEKIPAHFFNAATHCGYHSKVFIFPPWQTIYTQDNERKQSFEEAIRTYEMMKFVYLHYGYHLIEMPMCSVTERMQFILSKLSD